MTNRETVKQMVKVFGFDSVMEMVEAVRDEIRAEEEKLKKVITNGAWKREYPEWVNETFERVTREMGVRVSVYGAYERRSMAITCPDFAKYIIFEGNDQGILLKDVLSVLLAAPAWSMGRGMTRKRMEIVFHILALHRDDREKVKAELIRVLNEYDPVALKVFANADDSYRHTLNYDAKMIAFTEKEICESIKATAKFRVA